MGGANMTNCESIGGCPFFNDKLPNMPSLSAYLKVQYCQDKFGDCARYRVRQALGGGKVPSDLFPNESIRAGNLISAAREWAAPADAAVKTGVEPAGKEIININDDPTNTLFHRRIKFAQEGKNPTVICKVSSGWVVLGDLQFLKGYSLLLADPVVRDINTLPKTKRLEFLHEMSVVGDALLEATDAYRINYEILGNQDQQLHAHIFPRYTSEPEELRRGDPWEYVKRKINQQPFYYERDRELMKKLADIIAAKLG
jgi:diadenosine tetraphosphate (Ap4A) HIT family hydrolase